MNNDETEREQKIVCYLYDDKIIGKQLGSIIETWLNPDAPVYSTLGAPEEICFTAKTLDDLKNQILKIRPVRFQDRSWDNKTK